MTDTAGKIDAPNILRLTVSRFRGIEKLTWYPKPGLNVILGGGDVGKSTILDAIALLLHLSTRPALSDVDFWRRETQHGFEIEAVMFLPESVGINQQATQIWPWEWDGTAPKVPSMDDAPSTTSRPVYVLRVRASADFDLTYELAQPSGSVENLSIGVRRAIGLVRLSGDDRNDQDLRLVQGSALDRLLSDRTLRSRLGLTLSGSDIEQQLKEDGKEKLRQLDTSFQNRALPVGLALGLTGSQGFSIAALVGLTAEKDGVHLPLASWGAGTRRLASLEIAASCQGDYPITLVDEVERGLEPYRQRVLIDRLQTQPSQSFLTTHSATAIGAANRGCVWYVDAKGTIGELPRSKILRQQGRDPETFLARLTIVAEGAGEKGCVRFLLDRALPGFLHDRGIWVTEGSGHESSLELLEALAAGGLQFGGFVDNEGHLPQRWRALKEKLGSLMFQWTTGCLEENIINAVADEDLERFIIDPDDGYTGDRLRTLADRLGIAQKDFATIKSTAPDLRRLIMEAALGRIPTDKTGASDTEKKVLKRHDRCWFKSFDGGRELGRKCSTSEHGQG